ncbi:MAG: UDP-N-acetylmuramoyl-L-alanine--D-glutamate ligase [Myxococcota bacterium]
MELSGKRCVVVGLGETGLSVVRFLRTRGAHIQVNDQRDREALADAAVQAEALGAELFLGGHPEKAFEGADVVVVSPGVPQLEALDNAARRGAEVLGEIELASRFLRAPVVAVTGTNGKSTVTTLIGKMCERLGRPLFVGGNLGRPMIEAVDTDAGSGRGLLVVELSSFQLERLSTFRAHVAVLLNVSDDHLDRYDSFEAYRAAKGHIFDRQEGDDYAIVPAGAPELEALVQGKGSVARFDGDDGTVRVEGGAIVDFESSLRVPLESLRIRGSHNVSNACAAALAARFAGVGSEDIAQVLQSFEGLPHRMEFVDSVEGIEFIDDSKATNVGAAVASLAGLSGAAGKVVLIAGGVDKGGAYSPLVDEMDRRGRGLVLIGDAAPLIEEAFVDSKLTRSRARTMNEAVEVAASLASRGDTVLLAPACSSFDMFRSYADRGDAFQRAVARLGERG